MLLHVLTVRATWVQVRDAQAPGWCVEPVLACRGAEAGKDRFIDAWSVLDVAYAVAEGRLRPIPTALTDPDIADALNDLDALIGEVVDQKN